MKKVSIESKTKLKDMETLKLIPNGNKVNSSVSSTLSIIAQAEN